MQDIKSILESWNRIIEPFRKSLDSSNRYDALLVLFSLLRSDGFGIKDLNNVNEIYTLLHKDFKDKSLNELYKKLVIMDITSIRDLSLPNLKREEKVVPIEVVEIVEEPFEGAITRFQVDSLDEDDVLSKEGFMEAPDLGETTIDKDFLAMLGYKEYEY